MEPGLQFNMYFPPLTRTKLLPDMHMMSRSSASDRAISTVYDIARARATSEKALCAKRSQGPGHFLTS